MPNPDARDVKNVLADLRDSPADTTKASDAILQQVYLYLMKVPPSDTGEIHWFCKLAVPTTIEAATFLIRLMAYQSEEVSKWKSKLHQCLSTCASCVQGLESAKVSSQDTYLAAFPKESLKEFFIVFEKWELEEVLKDIDPTLNQSQKPLSETSLYRVLSNWTLFCNAQVLAYLESHPPIDSPNSWADLPLPPGIFVLLVARNAEVRTWASKCALRVQPLEPKLFIGSYLKALGVVHSALQLQSENSKPLLTSPTPAQPSSGTILPLEYANPSEFWPGVNIILRLIPPNYLKSNSPQPVELKRDIFGRLRDNNSDFNAMFKCFTLLLKRLDKDIWNGERPEYPQTIFEAIITNPSYIALLHESTSTYVAWIQEYLLTARSLSTYTSILEKAVDFLFSEAELERSRVDAPALLKVSMNILLTDLRRLGSKRNAPQLEDFQRILDLHTTTIISVAYTNHYNHSKWSSGRQSARCIVEEALSVDVGQVKEAIITLSHILGQLKQKVACKPLPPLSIREGMWNALSTIQPEDTDAIAEIVCIVGKMAHLSSVRISVFSTQWGFPAGDESLSQVNKSLATIQSGFFSLICSVSDSGISAHPLDILQHAGVGNAVFKLLLSPCEEIQTAGKTLAGLAFDVDGRMDCFRALLENLPSSTFDGMFEFFDNFRQCALSMPEACNLSATLVLCFADVLDVLCSSPDGLLLNTHFRSPADDKGPAARIPQFWKLLTEALSIIYRRTPMWAEHVEIPEMVIWMRDALILARDVLKQWRVIENAANTYVKVPARSAIRKLSPIGKQMIEALQDFLPELVRWLRLTDEELLHQSFSLLQSLLDLMKETHVRPAATALGKLAKYVEGKSGANREQTRLDSGRLLQLSEALAHFHPVRSDEVEIVSHTHPTTTSALEASQAKAVIPRSHVQAKGQQPHPKRRPTVPTVPSLPGHSPFFSNRDQQRLESATSMPSFRKSGSSIPVPPNKKLLEIPQLHGKTEALRQLASSEESASSSDSGEEDAVTEGLANLGRFPKSPKKPRPIERRQIKTFNIPTQINPMQDRVLRNKQSKINGALRRPDVSGLHKILLSWSYNHDGPRPPGEQMKLLTVPDRFDNYEHYFRVFQPLLLMECWAQLLQSKDEKQDSYQCKVDSRQYVDDWLDIDLTIAESVKKEWYLSETDIVLLRQPGHDKSIMAKIKSYKASMSGIQATIRCYVQAGAVDPGLQITTLWQISKIFSLSTLHREYGALLSLQHNHLLAFILRPSLPLAPRVDADELRETMDAYKVNEPQATAILKSLNTTGFSLIQGPPGTGKTSTICGLISRFISKRPRGAVPIIVGSTAASSYSSRRQEEAGPTAKVLLCAPSNAAIDELAQRLKDGYVGSEIRANPLNLVRIGADQAMSSNVRDISLDYLVDQELDGAPKPFSDIGNEIKTIRRELEKIKNDRNIKFEEMKKIPNKGAQKVMLENEVKSLNSRRQALMSKLDQQKDQQRSESRTLDALRRNTRREVLNKADIICCTLSGSGHESLENLEFDMVVIDEAAQSIELSSLIPLKYLSSHCVMVGDPQQLPPTVISQEATRYGYNQSLFVRLQRSRKEAVHLLTIQYRMHPDISCLPSRVFYDNKLIDGPSMSDKTKQPWHTHEKFGTYKFLNISWGIEEPSGRSIKNSAECNVAMELFKCLRHEFSSVDFNSRIGIISMYKAQINALKKLFGECFGNAIGSRVDFNTVDGFQGQEKDVIILSCVRAGPGLTKVGFLSDIRRMNVALTRAKSSLFILGNVATLERSDNTWHQIIDDARSRSALVNINPTYFARSASPSEVTAPPPKKKHRSTAPPISVPSILSTPHEIGASTSILKASMIIQSQESDSKTNGVTSRNPSVDNPARGAKRSAENLEAGPSSANKHPRKSDNPSHIVDAIYGTSRASDMPTTEVGSSDPPAADSSNKRPQKPDQKRKRPKPQTMFIPKKRT